MAQVFQRAWGELYVNVDAIPALFHWDWTFREIRLKQPSARLAYLGNGRFNLSNRLLIAAPKAAAGTPKGRARANPSLE